MKPLKLLHFADLHFSRERAETCFKILDFVKEQARINKVDTIVFAGDLCEKALLNSYSHFLPQLQGKLNELASVAPIFMIYGTDYHDPPGSLEIFANNLRITIVRAGEWCHYEGVTTFFYCIPDSRPDIKNKCEKMAFYVEGMSGYYSDLCNRYAAHRREHIDSYAVVIGHGAVKGSNAHPGEKTSIIESQLAHINADYYCFGHEHRPKNFATIPGGYSGSFAQSWKELDYKPAIKIIEIESPGCGVRVEDVAVSFIPERMKISNPLICSLPYLYKNKLVWFEAEKGCCTAKQDLIDVGAHPDSIVTIKAEPRQPVRNTTIHTLTTYRELYQSYRTDATEQELAICDDIQQQEINKRVYGEKRTIIPLALHIKGLKQLFDETGQDQLTINFRTCQGLTGIIGRGGIGKTSISLCIPPHSVCMAQENTIASMFEHKGGIRSIWEVTYEQRKLIIDTVRAFSILENGKTETTYHVHVNNIVNASVSSKESYDQYINDIFGSPRMFALTTFRPQFPCYTQYQNAPINPDLFTLTNSDFKTLVSELTNCSKKFAYEYCAKKSKEAEIKRLASQTRLDYLSQKETEQAAAKSQEMILAQIVVLESEMEEVERKIKEKQIEEALCRKKSGVLRSKDNIAMCEKQISQHQVMIDTLKAGCKNCGFVDNENQKAIKWYQNNINDYQNAIKVEKEAIATNSDIENTIDNSFTEWDYMQVLNGLTYDVKELQTAFHRLSDQKRLLLFDSTRIEQLTANIAADKQAAQIQHDADCQELELWERMAVAWHRDGIPAMILENVAPEIDQIVNSLLDTYYPRLEIMTATLKGEKESFHADVYKRSTGRIYPFSALSGEERNFIDAAFREACRRIYERTANIIYKFSIMDEPDAAVSEDMLASFWDMQRELTEKAERLTICVSHSPNAKQAFNSTITIGGENEISN